MGKGLGPVGLREGPPGRGVAQQGGVSVLTGDCIILGSPRRWPRKDFVCVGSEHAVDSPFGPDFRHRLEATEKNKAPPCPSHTESLHPGSVLDCPPAISVSPGSRSFGQLKGISQLSEDPGFAKRFYWLELGRVHTRGSSQFSKEQFWKHWCPCL